MLTLKQKLEVQVDMILWGSHNELGALPIGTTADAKKQQELIDNAPPVLWYNAFVRGFKRNPFIHDDEIPEAAKMVATKMGLPRLESCLVEYGKHLRANMKVSK